ncbi:pyocin knob domain-containing protein [Paenibacillus typhae]|uniref:Phage tail fibre repeat-containing protein n=1 Tax=Paenibacillus typhae TaxID=1174501 RepID=A0A1G8QKA8_9BACL|nr:pyocin knob domain-containing protein [Paenibacillus typhae]SDJ04530.1 hypothetical protein SAMN05216192_11133 [Paenibacillus typhae]
MKTTGNLGLKKPDGTDIVDISDINGNMDILDTAVKGAQDHAADAVKHITSAERTAWNAKASTAAATASAAGLMAAADKAKLDGVAAGANNYAHPATHPATMITEDATHRFATDTEKSTWNAKASTSAATSTVAGLMSAADKAKLDGVATGANNYTHPNHTGDVTSTSDGVTAIAAGVIVDADVNSAAAIGWGKISKTGSSLADLVTRSAGDLSSGTLAAARLPAISGDITMAAGAGTAVITAGAIVNADVNASAAIDASKIGTGVVSNAEFAYLDGVTSAIQTQLNAKETPAGAQTKANTAESNAKSYTDAKAWQKRRLTEDDGTTININGQDLNSLRATGCFVGTGLYNSPDGSSATSNWYYVQVMAMNTNVWVKQVAVNLFTNTFAMRTGSDNNGTISWGAWSADLFQSVANGKSSIASAISGKGVAATGSDDFGTLAAKIGQINTGRRFASGAVSMGWTGAIWTASVWGLAFTPKTIIAMAPINGDLISIYDVTGNLYSWASSSFNVNLWAQYGGSNTGNNDVSVSGGSFTVQMYRYSTTYGDSTMRWIAFE